MKAKIFLWLTIVSVSLSYGQKNQDKTANYNVKNRLAIEGYDPVSYFMKTGPLKGKSNLTATFRDITYRFSSESNRTLFLADAKKYLPQYGGWCAYAMGYSGENVEVDPETFKILDGKLYLFYNAYFNNTLKSWNKDEKNLKIKADANWLKIN